MPTSSRRRIFSFAPCPILSRMKVWEVIQTRWTHINRNYNLLTRAIAIGIDVHFLIEQAGRYAAGCFQNFNGSGGVLRKRALMEAGGWQSDTLAEDLDASYRIQIQGYRILYLKDLQSPGEVPPTVPSYKKQQGRWACGSLRTAKKLLPTLMPNHNLGFRKRLQAFIHLTGYMVHPLMFTSFVLACLATLLRVDSFRVADIIYHYSSWYEITRPCKPLPSHRTAIPALGIDRLVDLALHRCSLDPTVCGFKNTVSSCVAKTIEFSDPFFTWLRSQPEQHDRSRKSPAHKSKLGVQEDSKICHSQRSRKNGVISDIRCRWILCVSWSWHLYAWVWIAIGYAVWHSNFAILNDSGPIHCRLCLCRVAHDPAEPARSWRLICNHHTPTPASPVAKSDSPTQDQLVVLLSIALQLVLALLFGHFYDMRISMATGYLVGTGQNPYVAQDLTAVFNNSSFQGMTSVGYPPPWPLMLGLLYRSVYPAFSQSPRLQSGDQDPNHSGQYLSRLPGSRYPEESGSRSSQYPESLDFHAAEPFLSISLPPGASSIRSSPCSLFYLWFFCMLERSNRSAILLALAISFKPIALPLLPVVLIYQMGKSLRQAIHYSVVFFAGVILFCVVPFIIFGWDPTPI